jgi:hypothetical protein
MIVNIFIDESGSFANTEQKGEWNTVVAYASPEVDSRKMKLILNRLKKKCAVTSSSEIKLKHTMEHDYIDFLKNLCSLNGVLFCTVTDASHNTLANIAQHQDKQVQAVLYHPPLTLSSYNHPFRDFLPLVFNPRVAS